ncbi:hypothetical protein NLX62_01355 [Mycobacteriaceae bacterium Msp059]|nr:hypothetical protein [Mycobacteriaceae bacterium Msp059]
MTNFDDIERPAAELLLDSLQVGSPSAAYHGLKSAITALTPLLQNNTGVLVPALSIEDIRKSASATSDNDAALQSGRTHWVAYENFDPAERISATPGSEAAIGNLIRELTRDRPGREPGPWLHPGTNIDTLRSRRCRLIVVVTDYIGSGRQIRRFSATFPRNARLRSWRSFGWIRIVVVAYAASAAGRAAAEADPSIDRVLVHRPAASFQDASWTEQEREQITELCKRNTIRKNRFEALGFDGSGGLYFTHTAVPNNLPFILRRPSTPFWKGFLDGRAVPSDLVAELGDYEAPTRNMANVVRAASQIRLGRAIDSGRLQTPTDEIVAALALIANGPESPQTLTHALALPDQEAAAIVDFLLRVGLITEDLTLTIRGYNELRHARRLDRITTARLHRNPGSYYPQSLR